MRTQFCAVETKEEALHTCPWAAEVAEVDGGFKCFESVDDFKTWKNQQ